MEKDNYKETKRVDKVAKDWQAKCQCQRLLHGKIKVYMF